MGMGGEAFGRAGCTAVPGMRSSTPAWAELWQGRHVKWARGITQVVWHRWQALAWHVAAACGRAGCTPGNTYGSLHEPHCPSPRRCLHQPAACQLPAHPQRHPQQRHDPWVLALPQQRHLVANRGAVHPSHQLKHLQQTQDAKVGRRQPASAAQEKTGTYGGEAQT